MLYGLIAPQLTILFSQGCQISEAFAREQQNEKHSHNDQRHNRIDLLCMFFSPCSTGRQAKGKLPFLSSGNDYSTKAVK